MFREIISTRRRFMAEYCIGLAARRKPGGRAGSRTGMDTIRYGVAFQHTRGSRARKTRIFRPPSDGRDTARALRRFQGRRFAMKSHYFSGRRAGLAVALLCALGFTLAASGTAQAQYRHDRDRRESSRDWRRERERNRGNVYDRNRNGVDDRYERGSVYDRNRNGVDDRYESGSVYDRNRNGVDDRYENSSVYDRNRNGVDDRYESGSVYDRNRNGVDDRYERNGGYGNSGGYYGRGGYGNNGYNIAQVAADQGYRDGLNTGASDGQRGQSYNPQRSHYYREATDGYNSSYGNRATYQQYYRDGFVRGYQEGFRQYGNGRNGRNYPNNGGLGGILGNIFGRP
jgi:hypothetical protein